MAIDLSLLSNFLPIFIFIFIFILLYAILEKTKILGDNHRFNFLISLAISFVTMFSGAAVELIEFITPWFAFMMVFLLLIFALYMFLGVKEKDVWPKIGGTLTVFIIFIIILIIGITKVFGPVFTPHGVEGGSTVLKTIFHPRVIGAFFLLLIASFLIKNISENV